MKNYLNRRDFLKALGATAAAITLPSCLTASENSASISKPNIVLILADDMGFSDIGCYGGQIDTPNIDKLAANGLKFTQFYNYARCCPTRASILTGLYPHQAGVGHMNVDLGVPEYQGYLNDRCVTIAEALKPAGYAAYMTGKWHLCQFDMKANTSSQPNAWPIQRGFDRYYGTLTGASTYYDPIGLMLDNVPIKADSPNYYLTDAISDQTVKFINDHIKNKSDQPFFMYVAFTSPHWPLHSPENVVAKYKGRFDKGWDALREERYKKQIDLGIIDKKWPLSPRNQNVPPWEKAENKQWWSRCMEVYAAQIDIMDQGIGRIVSALEKAGKLDNTLILFLSDNGACHETIRKTGWYQESGIAPHLTHDGKPVKIGNDPNVMPGPENTFESYERPWANFSNTPFRRFKSMMHEGGIATPLIVHWPARIKAKNQLRHQIGHIIDIMPTCLDAAAAEYPKTYKDKSIIPPEGKSLTPAFDDKNIVRDALCFEHQGNRAVRLGDFKLVAKNKDPWELYDVSEDRTELNNLIEKLPEKAKEMETIYDNWTKRCGVIPWAQIAPSWAKNEKGGE